MGDEASASGDDPFAIGVVEWTLDVVRSRVSSAERERGLLELLQATDQEQRSLVALWDVDRSMGMEAGRQVVESRGFTVVVDADDEPGPQGLLDLVGLSADRRHVLVVDTVGGDEEPVATRVIGGVSAERGSGAYLNDSLHRDGRWLRYLRDNADLAAGLADRSIGVEYLRVFARADGEVFVSILALGRDVLRLDDLVVDASPGSGSTP